MLWWVWLICGFVLLALELVIPTGFFVFFLGLSGVGVGLIAATGALSSPWLQWMTFAFLSIALLVLFRKNLMQRFGPVLSRKVDSMVGETATALDDLPVDSVGKVELRGSPWSARNSGARTILRGERCAVKELDGLTVIVEPL